MYIYVYIYIYIYIYIVSSRGFKCHSEKLSIATPKNPLVMHTMCIGSFNYTFARDSLYTHNLYKILTAVSVMIDKDSEKNENSTDQRSCCI